MARDLAEIRRGYQEIGLSEQDAPTRPADLLKEWFDQAAEAGVYLHNTMVLATASADGRPSARAVILRQIDDGGLVFYTNYESHKARELEGNENAACLLFWPELARQIRVDGPVSSVPAAESDRYFASRERGAQLEAWASPQSETISNREWLEGRFQELDARFAAGPVPRPDRWGGLRLKPDSFEFWQGRPHRMHDRLLYTRAGDGSWNISRLAP